MSRRRWIAAAGAALVLGTTPGLTGGVALAATADSGLGIRLLDAPTALRDDPRARVYIVDFVHPGTTFTRHVQVSNNTANPAHVALYPDAATLTGGAFVVGNGHATNELTSWMSVSPSSLDLPAHGTGTATLTLAVPADAAAGERYAVILADVASTGSQGLLVSSRVGIRTYLDVGPGAAPASAFTIDTLQAIRRADGTPALDAQVHNTGGRALDMRGTLDLTNGPAGLKAGPFTAQLGSTLAPGDTQPVTVPLDKALPDGPWTVRITLRSGLLERSATATITFPTSAGTTTPPVHAKAVPLPKNFHTLVAIAGGLVAAIALTLGGSQLLRRRRRTTTQ